MTSTRSHATKAPRDEVEAKLLAPDEDCLRELAGRPAIGRFRLEPSGREMLHSVYLDTADRRLLGGRIALRLRRSETGYEITAKWQGSVRGDVHVRREINVAVTDVPSLPFVLPDGELRDDLAGVVGDSPLEALVVVDIDRQTLDVFDGGPVPVAELALDVVRHSAPGGDAHWPAYCEVEVESTHGSVSVIGEIAAALRAEFPLGPTSGTKFSRARRDVCASHRGPS